MNILGLHDFVELLEDQRHLSKKNLTAYSQYMVKTQMVLSLSIYNIYGLTSK